MKTKTINLYTINELSPEAQEKARQDYIAHNDYEFLEDDMICYLKEELLPTYNIIPDNNLSIRYSLSYCQGDGAMFEGTVTWDNKYRVKIQHSGHYCHYNSKDFEIFDFDMGEAIYDSELDKKFDDVYVKICEDLAKYGYDVMETSDSMENFKETCEANDYYFTNDGELTSE